MVPWGNNSSAHFGTYCLRKVESQSFSIPSSYLLYYILELRIKNDIFLIPTLWLYRRLVELGERGEIPEWKYKRALSVVPKHTRSFHLALEAGVKIAAGTDSRRLAYAHGRPPPDRYPSSSFADPLAALVGHYPCLVAGRVIPG